MKITRQLLTSRRACTDQVRAFHAAFPAGLDVTGDPDMSPGGIIDQIVAAKLDLSWAASALLPAALTADYEAKHAPLLADYEAKRASLLADYEAKRAALLADYGAKRAPIFADYEAKRAPLYADYRAKHAPLLWCALASVPK